MPHVCDLFFPPPQKPGMVPPPPGEESQTVVLPPGWQSYLSPQGRRYYVNTATNGESCSGQHPTAAPGVLSVWRGTSLLHFLGFRPFLQTSSEAARRFFLPPGLGGRRSNQGGEGCPSRLGVIFGTQHLCGTQPHGLGPYFPTWDLVMVCGPQLV